MQKKRDTWKGEMKSTIVRRVDRKGKASYQVKTVLDNGREFTDCERFKTRIEAIEMIPSIEIDLKNSLEKKVI
jgi:hypothetical protein